MGHLKVIITNLNIKKFVMVLIFLGILSTYANFIKVYYLNFSHHSITFMLIKYNLQGMKYEIP